MLTALYIVVSQYLRLRLEVHCLFATRFVYAFIWLQFFRVFFDCFLFRAIPGTLIETEINEDNNKFTYNQQLRYNASFITVRR